MRLESRRNGVVLLLALLCLLALEITAVGLHFITIQELRTSHSAERDLQLRVAARSAAASVLSAWPATRAEMLALHERYDVDVPTGSASGGVTTEASIERLDTVAFLVTGSARSTLGEVRRIGAVVTMTSPAVLASSITAALRTGGAVTVTPGSRVTGAVQQGAPVIDLPLIGSLHFTRLAQLARYAALAHKSTEPDSGIIILPGGSPIPDGLTARIVIIDGSASMHGGAFNGVLIVRGSLTIDGGAAVNGAVIVIDGPVHLGDGSITFDPAGVLGALSNPLLRGPYRMHTRTWIPVF